jgi:hypothetical protein
MHNAQLDQANPQKLASGCWNIQQNGPDQIYNGTLSLSQDAQGGVNGRISWASPYGGTTVTGTIQNSILNLSALFTSPQQLQVNYTGTVTSDGMSLVNGTSQDANGERYALSGSKVDCNTQQDTLIQCWTTKQEKSPGSNTWWLGTFSVKMLSNGTIVGGTVQWNVPSSGKVTGGSISGITASINTYNDTYNMNVVYAGSISQNGTIITGTSNGSYTFEATKTNCQ